MNRLKLRQQDDAFLLIGVSPGNDGGHRLRRARIVGQVRHIGGYIEEIPGPNNRVVLQTLTMPDMRNATQRIDRCLVGRMLVREGDMGMPPVTPRASRRFSAVTPRAASVPAPKPRDDMLDIPARSRSLVARSRKFEKAPLCRGAKPPRAL